MEIIKEVMALLRERVKNVAAHWGREKSLAKLMRENFSIRGRAFITEGPG